MMTSRPSSILGSGTLSQRMSFVPCQQSAFISLPLSGFKVEGHPRPCCPGKSSANKASDAQLNLAMRRPTRAAIATAVQGFLRMRKLISASKDVNLSCTSEVDCAMLFAATPTASMT